MYQIYSNLGIVFEETHNSEIEVAVCKEAAWFTIACIRILTVVKREHSWRLSFRLKDTFSGSHINTSIEFYC